jgi:hypothetical protein
MVSFVDRQTVTIGSVCEARPGETVRVDANEATEVLLPPARSCPGAAVEIKEVAYGEETTTIRPAPGDTVEGQAELRITGGVQSGVRRYVTLRSDGALDAIRRGEDPASAAGDWMIVADRGLR